VKISAPFIRRPIATSLLMVAVVLLGILGYRLLPISSLPAVDFPTIQVVARYPGASPEVVCSGITTPMERQFGVISGLLSMSSSSSFGVSTITLQFGLDRDIDVAAQDVQAAINAARGYLPPDLPDPPVYSKVNPADTPILTLAITSDSLPISRVNDLADTLLAQKLSQITGVGLVTIQGNQKPAVRVRFNPSALAALKLGTEDLRAAIQQANVNAPKGSFDGAKQSFLIGTNDQIFQARDYAPLIIAYRDGAPVRLGEVAAIEDGVENDAIAAWVDNRPAVLLDIQRQPGANIIQTVDRIQAMLPRLTASLPPAVKVSVLIDRTQTIRASVDDVQFTLVLTVFLVVLVIFLFLRHLWATAIPSVALPLSLMGTFGIMSLCGFSLNNLSLMALTISTGFVVDDAIVMLENIFRHIEAGAGPLEAALDGAREIGFTVVSLSVSLIAVFIPLLFMSGVVGRLFHEFAITLSAAVIVSAIVSLTLTPMMCARFLQRGRPEVEGRLGQASERAFAWLRDAYAASLRVVLRHETATLLVAAATLAATVWLYLIIPKGLLPEQDTGLVIGVTDAAQSISFEAMAGRQQEVSAIIGRDPDVRSVASFVGAGTVNPTINTGRLYIVLKPRGQRASDSATIMKRLGEAVSGVHGISLFLQPAQDLQIDTRISRTQYHYVLQDASSEELNRWAPRLLEKMAGLPSLVDAASDQQSAGLQVSVDVDRQRAARLGVPTKSIDETLYDCFGQRPVSIIFTERNQYRVILSVQEPFRTTPETLDKIHVKSNSGRLVPLSSFASLRVDNAPLVIAHEDQFPAVTLSFNLAPGASLGQAVAEIRQARESLGLPPSVMATFTGAAAEFESSLRSQPFLILAAIIVIYIVLGVLYESYIHPATILSTLPSAGVGALLALLLFRIDFSLIALIGIILLIGIVKKNAIMMIDFALEAQRERALPPSRAIYEACLLRFRPIMMTTMAALLGALPLAVQAGTGSELRRPLGITIVGGLLVSQFLTLYTTPVIYLAMERVESWVMRRRAAGSAPASA